MNHTEQYFLKAAVKDFALIVLKSQNLESRECKYEYVQEGEMDHQRICTDNAQIPLSTETP